MKQEKDIPPEHHFHRTGEWLPHDHRAHQEWLAGVIAHVDQNPKDLHPVLREFQALVENNTRVWLLFSSMFQQVPNKPPYNNDPRGPGHPQVRDHVHMLQVINHILTTAPSWNDKSERVGLVGLPFNALFDWPMGTSSGFAAFLDPEVNAMLKKVLNAWGDFLRSPESASVLERKAPASWFSDHGHEELSFTANVGKSNYKFEDMFVCDPSDARYGYKSWDDFFTRRFREHIRPVASPDDDSVIANACESKTYKVARNVKARDHFWLKGQPYSVRDMLAQDALADQFVGGTVYQAFLSALSYHRWHAPVSGKLVKAYVVDGTYYSEPLFEDFSPEHGADPSGQVTSQGYLTATATRAIMFFQADNPAIGLMAFLGIGMCEVSTCEMTVKEGQHVNKGDEIGMFHFGGSTHCLLFRKGVEVEGFPEPHPEHNIPLNSALARVKTT
ncbi:phosphatidylserine decarboxylase [Capronia epimyces CBS 606.96]|uniref:Phosphatidylserine decarboxylase n=1 Tax=Capronia epimyces CBS 606.96 TaxID=1182542 RepID=W9XCK2_9EURO|nr:phosphatidylserine decarboxylase [Capronia epimyces CBS 606.96]EXJ77928.1 phosphatidylserine decarboxylase [Capronia epimyces CBS 606.96]